MSITDSCLQQFSLKLHFSTGTFSALATQQQVKFQVKDKLTFILTLGQIRKDDT